MSDVDDAAARLALASLPGASPASLTRLLREHGSGTAAWDAVRSGSGADGARWRGAARDIDPAGCLAAHRAAGLEVLGPASPGWPDAFTHDPAPPAVLVGRGDLGVLDRPVAALVGTRRATPTGLRTAASLARGLAAAGVTVGSGLALGIDGASQRAALDAGGPVLGVVASGLDVVYPRRHRDLWQVIGERGLLLSEWPLGVTPDKWRFPARNRVLAALAHVVVVVESAATGGSMHTVDAALARQREVLAVPGSILRPETAGTNRLIADGATVVCDVDDVLDALGVHPAPTPDAAASGGESSAGARGASGGTGSSADIVRVVLDVLDAGPADLHELAAAAATTTDAVAVEVARLEARGAVVRRAGRYERMAS